MKIGITVITTNDGYLKNNAHFIFEYIATLALQQQQDQFIFFANAPIDEKYFAAKNISAIIFGKVFKRPFQLQYWINYKLPSRFRKQQIDVLLHASEFCCLLTKLPQCLVVAELSFLNYPKFYNRIWLRFYKKNMVKNFSKAYTIIAASKFIKNEIATQYSIAQDKIKVIYFGANSYYKPATASEKENTQLTFTNGKAYFLYFGTIQSEQNLIALLKAFSFFKKRQKSNMQLVIATSRTTTNDIFTKSLSTFKFRDDVQLLNNGAEEIIVSIIAAAYALVYTCTYDGVGATVIKAMQCGVPVIASNTSALPEIGGNALLYINPDDYNNIADKMMLLYKDEIKRNEQIAKGQQLSNLYLYNKTIGLLWATIAQLQIL